MSKILYVTDLDGTLLNNESKVSAESARIITDLSRAGALITVATARTPATVQTLLADTLTTPPAVVMTGASLWDRQSVSYLEPKFLEFETVKSVYETMVHHGLCPFVYMLPSDNIIRAYHPAQLNDADADFVAKRNNLPLKRFIVGSEPVFDGSVGNCIIVFTLGDPDKVFAAAAQIEADASHPCSVSAYSDPCSGGIGVLEVKAPGTSKADSVRRVAQLSNAERIVVFGDNINDLSMMGVADVAVAVGNAVPAVLEAADIVIDTNETDSVARFIKSDFLRNG